MLKIRSIALTALCSTLMAGASWAQTKWDFPTAYPVTNFHTETAQQFVADVEKATANALRLLDQLAGQLEIKADQTVNVVHSADKAQIDQWVKDVARARIRSFPEELDVLDAEVVDDETPRRDELEGASAPGAPETSDGQTRRLDPEASDVP